MSVIFATPAVPAEIWSHILKEIPKPDLPPLLSVCSLFHDIAIRFLFASIKIYFIGLEKGGIMLNMRYHNEWVEEVGRKLMVKSWELLNRITQDSHFARIVKSVTVISFTDKQGFSIFERMTLANALLCIPNLETFRWIGTSPEFDDTVAQSLPATLRNLEIQSSLPLESLSHLSQLEGLYLSMPWFFPDDEEAHDGWTQDEDLVHSENELDSIALESLFTTIGAHITRLRLSGLAYSALPVRILDTLLDLEIFFLGSPDEMMGLDMIFRHASQLQSLTWIGHIDHEAYSLLPSSTSSLPRLTSFRLSEDGDSDYDSFNESALFNLLRFIDRKTLRRLYVRLPNLRWPQGLSLWMFVSNLDNLEVLGLHTGYGGIGDPELDELLKYLPRQLRALHIALDCVAHDLLPLVDAIANMPKLTFLQLYGTVSRLPILLEDLANENEGLQTIGLNRALWDISRVGTNIITNKWPRWKIKFNTEEDFLNEDDAWLFKYH